ncbi:MAG: AraC family transcriptional regulator [Acutalibacteraceae bacterium]|nr:AraC family transcriptional regulator [Acutalibacteraceae bacterium]
MKTSVDNLLYRSVWKDIYTDTYEGFLPVMSDFHMHEYFEISIIISGNVNVLLKDSVERSSNCKVVFLKPYTPHYIYCEPDILYKRRNVLFSSEFIVNYVPEWEEICVVFKDNGAVCKIDEEQCKVYIDLAEQIETEKSYFRKRLLLLQLLSLMSDNIVQDGDFSKIPPYVSETLNYISNNYSKKILCDELANKFGVGRTTFMTGFKKYTGSTFNEFLNRTRLKYAISALEKGMTENEAAEQCGFGEASNFIRCCKRSVGMTPKKYIMMKYKK